MNICFVINMLFEPNHGGVQQSTYKLAKIFEHSGHKVVVLSFADGESTSIDDIEVRYLGETIASSAQLIEIFNQFNPDICINQAGFHVKITKLLRKVGSSRMKLVNTIRINPLNFVQNASDFITSFLKSKRLSFIPIDLVNRPIVWYHRFKQHWSYKIMLHHVDALVFLSPSFIGELSFFRIDPGKYNSKLFSIPNPFPFDKSSPDFSKKENSILFVGRLNLLQKRTDLLMQIWKRLHDRIPNWSFLIVGNGPEMNNMKNYCIENHLDRVSFLGYNNPKPYYEKAKILHFTSAFEGFGNVLVEAQRDGVIPILFDSYAAAKDIVQHQRNGILVNTFNIDAFVDETINLIDDHQKLRQLSIQAHIDARQFSYQNVLEKWINLFYEIECLE